MHAPPAAVTDGDISNTTEATVTLEIRPPQALNATDDVYNGQASQNITVVASNTTGLLSNDVSPNASPRLVVLTAGPLSNASAGQLTSWTDDGSFVFVPAARFTGEWEGPRPALTGPRH